VKKKKPMTNEKAVAAPGKKTQKRPLGERIGKKKSVKVSRQQPKTTLGILAETGCCPGCRGEPPEVPVHGSRKRAIQKKTTMFSSEGSVGFRFPLGGKNLQCEWEGEPNYFCGGTKCALWVKETFTHLQTLWDKPDEKGADLLKLLRVRRQKKAKKKNG